jgi:hypothetical protein
MRQFFKLQCARIQLCTGCLIVPHTVYAYVQSHVLVPNYCVTEFTQLHNINPLICQYVRRIQEVAEYLTSNAAVTTVLGSTPASSDTVESEGR